MDLSPLEVVALSMATDITPGAGGQPGDGFGVIRKYI